MCPGPSAFSPPELSPLEAGKGGVPLDAALAAQGGVPLPCLSSHNSIQRGEVGQWNLLQGSHRKTAQALVWNIQAMAEKWGIERLGFLTLTFAENVQAFSLAAKRFNSLASNVLRDRYPQTVRTAERQKSGRWHFHCVVVAPGDIRTGSDFDAFDRGDYRSAGPLLRREWAFWRETAPRYKFGRTELLPVKSTADGIARYVGKYVSKHIGSREERDKGARIVGYVGYKPGEKRASSAFTWLTPHTWEWRVKLAYFARQVGAETMGDLQALFGPRWAYHFQGSIVGIPMAEALGHTPPEAPARLRLERAR